ncbi:MAG: methyltransferase [Candidatus Omnitrophica bacterium CG11_big_fil_rev_8_21_14_0_20_64_10]|nr:MAG: methyltransferase [Candidatus Omnitrophica bacterium CG11_big_fil_rev_8_21_14_0_20_64_10]
MEPKRPPSETPFTCPLCGGAAGRLLFRYDRPPAGETFFRGISDGPYERLILRCSACGHCINRHRFDLSRFYEGDYVAGTYADPAGMVARYRKILSLPPEQSDNSQRVQAITAFWGKRPPGTALDVGSGLAVFPARMREAGWAVTALDPDPAAAEHARKEAGVEAVAGDWMAVRGIGRFDLITFNKVLEHVADPVAMLARAAGHLNPEGVVYVELPDAEGAAPDGPGREEFFIEHHHIFSPRSIRLLGERAGFTVRSVAQVREPSGKYTLRSFLTQPKRS